MTHPCEKIERPNRQLIVWYAGVSWNGIAGTDRQMATALTRFVDILWVDPPVSPMTSARFRHGASRWPIPTISALSSSMFRLAPQTLPLHTKGICRGLSARLVRWQIQYALKRLKRAPLAVVVSHFENVLGGWGSKVANVFYGTDDYVGGAELMGIARARIEEEERAQLGRADIVVAASVELERRWRALGFGGPTIVIPNGVAASAYQQTENAVSDSVGLPRPLAGFVGHLSSRIDISLLESVVQSGCSLLLVGPCNARWEPERFRALIENPRVKWVGPVEFSMLPAYLKAIDVGITPYADSDFNRASFPLKTLEYLAAGKPVVSTDLPAVRWLDTELITVASHTTFGEATRVSATAPHDPGVAKKRIAFAESHSWEKRAEVFASAVGLETNRHSRSSAGQTCGV